MTRDAVPKPSTLSQLRNCIIILQLREPSSCGSFRSVLKELPKGLSVCSKDDRFSRGVTACDQGITGRNQVPQFATGCSRASRVTIMPQLLSIPCSAPYIIRALSKISKRETMIEFLISHMFMLDPKKYATSLGNYLFIVVDMLTTEEICLHAQRLTKFNRYVGQEQILSAIIGFRKRPDGNI